ncbi:MAG: DNA polymerase III subunit gamma/tau [Alphaproteobacteria bacterium]
MGEGVKHDYVVLARKYRPRHFGELYGQDALVRTLSNAIASNKIHHAYVLTGIRGVGKTTTARIMAKALNCADGPSVTWDEADPQVQAITTGQHMDVYEYDAASNRGVDEVGKLFEGIAYAPVSGRFKVYIIDEVHMLSTTAFNALLKTLEEPPPSVKFIFATTEVNKIPITVLSRCQRFDLKRIPSETLIDLFTSILAKENIEAEPAAIAMVARAADGSARDGLSLLDQAIALSHGKVLASVVQEMLGLADRAQLYDLLEMVLGGRMEDALTLLDGLYARGQDALGVIQGLLEMTHLLTRLQVVPSLKTSATLTEVERTRAVPLSAKVSKANTARLYQMLVHAAGEVRDSSRPYEALSMALVRMAYMAPLPSMENMLKQAEAVVSSGHSVGAMAVREAPASPVPPPAMMPDMPPMPEAPPWEEAPPARIMPPEPAALPTEWAGVVAAIRTHKPALGASLGQQVRCVSLTGTELVVSIDRGLMDAKEILRDMRTALNTATGRVWMVEQHMGVSTAPTLVEQEHTAAQGRKLAAAEDPALKAALAMFPGAEIEQVESPH